MGKASTAMASCVLVLGLLAGVHSAPTTDDNLIPGTEMLTSLVSKGQQMMDLWLTEYVTAPYTLTAGPFEGGLEERRYPAMMWVCNKRTESELADGQTSKLFWPLFQYIQGGNVGNLTIAMTTPVTTLVTSEASGFSLEMCFFLGATKNTWPRPSSASVYLKQELPSGEHLTTTVEWTEDSLKKNQATITVEVTPNWKFEGIFGWDFQTLSTGNFHFDIRGENPWVGNYAIDRHANWEMNKPRYMFNWVGKSEFKSGPFSSFSPIDTKMNFVFNTRKVVLNADMVETMGGKQWGLKIHKNRFSILTCNAA